MENELTTEEMLFYVKDVIPHLRQSGFTTHVDAIEQLLVEFASVKKDLKDLRFSIPEKSVEYS